MAENNQFNEQVFDYHQASSITDSLFAGADYGSAGDYMTNVAGQETIYGSMKSRLNDAGVPISMSAYQIDPIRFKDFLTTAEGGAGKARLDMVNTFMKQRGYGEDFDLRNMAKLNEVKSENGDISYSYSEVDRSLARDPLASTMLMRTLLASDPNSVPSEMYNVNPHTGEREAGAGKLLLEKYGSWDNVPHKELGQSGYWKKSWNTDAGAGHPYEFEQKYDSYRKNVTKEDEVMDIFKDEELDFNIGSPTQ